MLDITPEDFAAWLESQGSRVFECRDACHCPLASYLHEVKKWRRPSVTAYDSLNLLSDDGLSNPLWLQEFVREVDSRVSRFVQGNAAAAIVRRVVEEVNA